MTCPYCKNQITEPAPHICPFCQKPINTLNPVSENTAGAVYGQNNPLDEAVDKIAAPIVKKRYFLPLIIIILLIFLVSFIFVVVNNNRQSDNNQASSVPTPVKSALAHNYDLDSNFDGIPDFVENATNYDSQKDQCRLNFSCGGLDPEYTLKNTVNILIILDSSGSMNEMAGSEKKMAAAKEALSRYISTLGASTNVALMVYGHKGSNNQKDKELSCSSIDLVYPFAKADPKKFLEAADSFQPTGWTSIGGALKKAKDAFTGKEGQKNYVLLISDGLETCDTNPAQAAKDLKASGIKPQIDVIGFNVDQKAKDQLNEISQIGEGTFYDAQTSEEFKKIVVNWWEAWKRNYEAFLCRDDAVNAYLTCYAGRYQAAITYLSNLQLSLSMNREVRGVRATSEDSVIKIQSAKDKATLKNDQENHKWKELYDSIRKEYRQNLDLLGTPSP